MQKHSLLLEKCSYKHCGRFVPCLNSSFFSDNDPLSKQHQRKVKHFADAHQSHLKQWETKQIKNNKHFREDPVSKGRFVESKTSPSIHSDPTSGAIRRGPGMDGRLAQDWGLRRRRVFSDFYPVVAIKVNILTKRNTWCLHLCNLVQNSPRHLLWHFYTPLGSKHWKQQNNMSKTQAAPPLWPFQS